MDSRILNKTINGFRNVFNRKKGNNRQEEVSSNRITFSDRYGNTLRNIERRLRRGLGLSYKEVGIKENNRQKKEKELYGVIKTAAVLKLPQRFAAEQGKDFITLYAEVCAEKAQIYPATSKQVTFNRVTGSEIILYVNNHSNDPTSVASRFARYNYSEQEFRQLPGDWVDCDITLKSFRKMTTNTGAANAPQHSETLKLINLTAKNSHLWLPPLLKTRIAYDIHDYQISTFGNQVVLLVSYHLPIQLGVSGSSQTVAWDVKSHFNTNLLDFKIVIEFPFNQQQSKFERTQSRLITGYLHDMPFKLDSIQTLQSVSPNGLHWGGTPATFQTYLSGFGISGMPAIKGPILFPILNLATIHEPKGQQIEQKYMQGFGKYPGYIETHYKNRAGVWLPKKKEQIDADKLSRLGSYGKDASKKVGNHRNRCQYIYNKDIAGMRRKKLI